MWHYTIRSTRLFLPSPSDTGHLTTDIKQKETADVTLVCLYFFVPARLLAVSQVDFLHIKTQQLKLAILKTTETSLVYYLFISFSCIVKRLFITPGGFFLEALT